MTGKQLSSYILHLATYPPRECGIATFTQDLTAALDKKYNPLTKSRIVAINDNPTALYNYGKKVVGQITANNIEDYVDIAKRVNADSNVKIINIQHEFGLFGGEWGDHLVPFLQVVEKPVVTTFHSVLPKPDYYLKNVVRNVVNLSRAAVVMNAISEKILLNDYQVPKSKIFLIPHGIPQTPFEDSGKAKAELGLESRLVLSTFGLLGPDKGIEYVIRAIPKIKQSFPNIIYLILGETHPMIRKHQGESYRNFLNREVEKLGLKENVKFYNKYLTLEEIIQYLKASDIYISTNLGARQSVSGTLSYALGCGRPAISTATDYAKYIINGKNGLLVRFKKSRDIEKSVIKILSDEKILKSMSAEAYENTRGMTWPNVAAAYFRIYEQLAELDKEEKKMPEVKLSHLMRLTDEFGILHHAKYSKPEPRYGYSSDDNARALIVAVKFLEKQKNPEINGLVAIYLNFLEYAKEHDGRFINIINSQKKKRKETFEEDVQGRVIWALGYAISSGVLTPENLKQAQKLFNKAVQQIPKIQSPRAIAFAIFGINFYLKTHQNKNLERTVKALADLQIKFYKASASMDWRWFEDRLTYSNSALPESLFYAYEITKNKKYLKVAEESLTFLSQITFEKSYYSPIGQNGWYVRNQKRAYFDQQPEDAASMVQTKVAASKITKKPEYIESAFTTFQWFLGKNHLNQMVYDEVTGGCNDGVGQYAINLNQGAESTLSYLLARMAIEELEQ